MRIIFCSALLMLGWSTNAVSAPTAGITFDDQCSSCSIEAQPGVPFLAYIVLSGWSRGSHCVGCGLAEINFELDGIPSGWTRSFVPSQLASFASDPFAAVGATIQFDPLLADVPDCLVLYTLTLVADATSAAHLQVAKHPRKNCDSPFPFPNGPSVVECPVVGAHKLCSIDCQPGGFAYTSGIPCQLTAVSQRPWGEVKRIYE